jgi:hypothetical protein
MRTPRLPAVDWTESPADLNGLVRLGERRKVVSSRVPSGFKRSLRHAYLSYIVTAAAVVTVKRNLKIARKTTMVTRKLFYVVFYVRYITFLL